MQSYCIIIIGIRKTDIIDFHVFREQVFSEWLFFLI